MALLKSSLQSKVPRCLNGVLATPTAPIAPRKCLLLAYSLAPKVGDDTIAQALGYPLEDYNPACTDDHGFVSLLFLR